MSIISGGNVLPGNGLRDPFLNAGAPTTNAPLAGTAALGSLLVDTTNGDLYLCTATNGTSTITWTLVGPPAA